MESTTLDSCCNILIVVIGLLVVYITAGAAGVSSGYILLTVVAVATILGVATFSGVGGNSLIVAVVVAGIVLALSGSLGINASYIFVGLILLAMFMGLSSSIGLSGAYLGIAMVAILVVVGIGWFVLYGRSATMPALSGFEDLKKKEGFYGGVAVGAGVPDCLRTSSEGARLHGLFASKVSGFEEGPEDFKELTLLLSQLSCFKKDLMGVGKQIEATRYQPFATQLDMEPIAETTARCFAKTIPSRDLEISLEKWGKRGKELIRRLCTSMNLTEMESAQADTLFGALMRDVSEVARSVCLSGQPTINGKVAPRQAGGYEAPELQELGPYNGYY